MTSTLLRAGDPARSSCAPEGDPTSAELLVGFGFRGWIAGTQTGDISHWQRVWTLYSSLLEPERARVTVGALSAWAKCLQACSRRRVEVNEAEACTFCRDECLAISMVAASQHSTCPALRACAFALIDNTMCDEVIDTTDMFAGALRCQDRMLSRQWIVNANAFCNPDARLPH